MSETAYSTRSTTGPSGPILSNLISLLRNRSPTLLFPVYALGVVGAFLQIAGAQWDVSWHVLGIVETFFTPAHMVLYTGIVVVAAAALVGLWLRSYPVTKSSLSSSFFTGVTIATVGSSLQVIAAPIDFWWHSTNGFDPYLFTPAHSLLIIGLFLGAAGMSLGTIRLLKANRAGLYQIAPPRILSLVTILGIATIWADLDFLGLYITDVRGMAYTFGYCSIQQFNADTCGFVGQTGLASTLAYILLLGAAGTFVFWGTKRLFVERGILTVVAGIIVGLHAVASFGFLAYAIEFLSPPGSFYFRNPSPADAASIASFIPVYLALLIPVALLDFAAKALTKRGTLFILSILVGPFVALLDGRFASSFIGGISPLFVAVIVAATVIGGLAGTLVLFNSTTRLFPKAMMPGVKKLGLQ